MRSPKGRMKGLMVGSILLTMAETTTATVVIGVVAALVGIGIGVLGVQMLSRNTIRGARVEAARIAENARSEAETAKEKIILDAERKTIELRQKLDAETNKSREEMRDQERRLTKREDMLDRKLETLDVKERHLDDRSKSIAQQEQLVAKARQEAEKALDEQKNTLSQLSGLTREQAKDMLLQRIEDECSQEVNQIALKRYAEIEEGARTKSQEILLQAVQRYAGEFTTESTVRSVAIPSDDMKGRIIGREGRNIRAIERATGVDVLVDDTPGMISVSCFDKVRQTIAVESLQKLLEDGRIHPTRIDEIVAGVQKNVEERIIRYGRDAANEVKLGGLHPKLVEAIGRLHFRTSYGQNMLKHSIEVAFLSQIIADQLGLDGELARRCGFLHDIGKAMDHEQQGTHPKLGMDFCRKYGEREEILNAVGGHHGDIAATSPYTPIVMAADAVSGARPGARRDSMEQYIQRLEQLEDIAKENEGVAEAYAIQAGREVRVIVDAQRVSDADAFGIARNIAHRVSAEMTFPGEIKVTVLRETRAIEFAT